MSWGTVLKGAGGLLAHDPAMLGKGLKYVAKGAVVVPLGAYAGWKVFGKGEGLDDVVVGVAAGDEAKKNYMEKGAIGVLKQKAMGSEATEKSLGENVVDEVAGKGSYQQIGDTASNVVEKTGEVLQNVGEGVQRAYNGAGEMIAGMTGGNGMSGVPYSDMNNGQLYQAYQQQALLQQNQTGGLLSMLNPFNSLGSLVGSITQGGSGLSLAALIPAAFLMFGNFGWMGKIASLFLGSLAMKNMRQPQVTMPSPSYQQVMQQGVPQQYVMAPSQQDAYLAALAAREAENENVVHRSRGLRL